MKLQLVATNITEHTITVMVDGVRYEYWIQGAYGLAVEKIQFLIRAGAYGKALNLLKRWSIKCERIL